MDLAARTSAQTHQRQSQQGRLMRNAEHLNQAQHRTCACLNLQEALHPPSTTAPNPCFLPEGLRASRKARELYEELVAQIESSRWPARVSHVPTPQEPCHGVDPPHVPWSSPSDKMAMEAAFEHELTSKTFWLAPHSDNQEKEWKQNGLRMEASSKKPGFHGEGTHQVILYEWYLIRGGGSSQGVEVSVGGVLTPGAAVPDRFKTAAIVQRLEKRRLLANDGLEILLAGWSDVDMSVSNGFSIDVAQAFFFGFPLVWNNLLLESEVSVSNPRHPNHQGSGNRASSTNNDLNTQPVVEDGEHQDQVRSRDAPVIDLVEQEIINVRNKEEQQKIAHNGQTTGNIQKRRGRTPKRQPCAWSEEDGTAFEQSGSGCVILNKSNGSTENVEKGDKCGQNLQLTPCITRSMQKTRRLEKEACTLEAVQACDHGTKDEEEVVISSIQVLKEYTSIKSVENCTEISQKNLNKRERSSKSPGQGNKCPKIRPPLPRPRGSVSKRLISAAFGLKTSRSGRMLVPPLAYWCSQALLRDKDGGIIGILEGSKNMSKDGFNRFTPPAEAGLRELPKQRCKITIPPRKRLGAKKRD